MELSELIIETHTRIHEAEQTYTGDNTEEAWDILESIARKICTEVGILSVLEEKSSEPSAQ